MGPCKVGIEPMKTAEDWKPGGLQVAWFAIAVGGSLILAVRVDTVLGEIGLGALAVVNVVGFLDAWRRWRRSKRQGLQPNG